MFNLKRFILLFSLLNCYYLFVHTKEPSECEVCESVLNKLKDQLPNDAKQDEIEIAFKDFCKKSKGKEERFCYYVGGLETSATYIIPEMSKPLSYNLPITKICREKLHKKDSQICSLRYDKQIDIETVDLKKLKVKDLKKILNDWGEDSSGFTEKAEFIKKIEEVKSLYTGPNAQKPKKRNTDEEF